MALEAKEDKSLFQISIPYLLLAIAIIAVSFSAIIVVKLLERDVPAEITAMYRTFFAGIGALILSIRKKDYKWIGKKTTLRRSHWIILAGLFLAIHFATWFVSLDYVSVAISTTLVDTVPIFLAIFGFLFFKEKINVLGVLGIVIAFGGGALLAFASPGTNDIQGNLVLGIGFSIIGALTVTFYFLIGKKILQDSPLWPYFAIVNLSSALFLLIYCLIRGYRTELFQYSSFVYLLFVIAALAPSLIGHATYNYSMRNLPAFVVGVAILGEPVGATILGVIMLDQKPDLIIILYAGIILIGIVLTSISQNFKITIPWKKKIEEETQ
ncbi:MAG: EamA family transporter [Candidatus Heimdallarchaeota archaeon]|nr:EamA family transporter [Candidatus Heimdallarchaeota archaeon]MCK4877703.1 EamA family transporter [Candidatus Heimdallarchaeota archaeon]